MKKPVTWSQDALDDFKQVIDYIAIRAPDAAMRVADKILENCDDLGCISTGKIGRIHGIYEKIVTKTPYIIAYSITHIADGESISILRVIHSARDWRKDHWPD